MSLPRALLRQRRLVRKHKRCLSIITKYSQGLDRLLPSDKMERIVKSQPLGRFGSVRDIADATVYLFADTGSYVSGQILVGESPLLPS